MSLPLFIADIWTYIINNFLEPETIEALGGVCSRLYVFANSDAVWLHQLEKLRQEYQYTDEELETMLESGKNLTKPRSAKQRFTEIFLFPNMFRRTEYIFFHLLLVFNLESHSNVASNRPSIVLVYFA
jgi:hypothetical protein